MAQKPAIPKGTRDFGPIEMAKRNYIFNTISKVYQKFGFKQIETPAMENLSTLMGKYGEEGDKLLFKILNSGDFLDKAKKKTDLNETTSNALTPIISEKGLRYDLTVPFARYIVQHRNEITFPFRRYQIQTVWRADRPQKGRYREFFQCDADVIGSNSLLNEVELIQIIDEVFQNFNIEVCIKMNNRKILAGIAEVIGHPDKIIPITVAIDKLDKIGLEKVNEELINSGLDQDAVDKLQPILLLSGTNEEKLDQIAKVIANSEVGQKGIDEIREIFEYTNELEIKNELMLDLTLARGLNYYTGAIFEVAALNVKMGSICGGGRYDDLTGIFGLKDVSGVGISFGADRIYDVLSEKDLFPEEAIEGTQILFINFGKAEERYAIKLLNDLRKNGVSAEIYPDAAKLKKQMTYADNNKIPFVIMAGSNEIENKVFVLKNMESGDQNTLSHQEIIGQFANRV